MDHTKKLYNAIGKSIRGRYLVYLANLISMMMLARLFSPELFGTVASISVFFVFFQIMTEAGLGPAIINLEKLELADRDGLFGLTLVVGLGFGLLFHLLSPFFLAFYQIPRVDEVVPYVALSLFFSAVTIVPSALLLRDQAFYRFAYAGLAAEVISTTASILLMQWIDSLHALAVKSSFSSFTNFLVLYFFSQNTEFGRPKIGTKFTALKPLLSFSSYQFGFNLINYFSRNLDNILVGKYIGAVSLGVYDKAYQLMRYPLMLLTFAMTPAIQPVVRNYSGDNKKVEAIHNDFTFKLSLIGASAGLGVFVLSDLIVELLLGSQWGGVIPIIKVLSVAIPVQVVLSTSGSFFQATNRADLLFLTGAISAVTMVFAIIWATCQRDLIYLSWALVAAFHINFFQCYYIMYSRIFRKNMFSFLSKMVPAGLVVLGMLIWEIIELNY